MAPYKVLSEMAVCTKRQKAVAPAVRDKRSTDGDSVTRYSGAGKPVSPNDFLMRCEYVTKSTVCNESNDMLTLTESNPIDRHCTC
ncbi:hypothetical protein [Heliothis virescens ascovirus 3g]|uniref:Uncharacterized protein n=4 Tax=Ascovirus TaxID=43680 RepID=K4NY86_9VIRU|nr:hypothetical protein F8203_gp072 [Heliothis virescens ascovirus 3f]YP_009702073.1 hypothetical protein F8204_gp080 [Heliothis virescens ascovirus 3g]AXN77254.1 hypothetical protein HvAV-3i_gp071 [Heliothis virescens ascovirus 3i]AYD68194.1 hypothetical protein [Heliothis virescens ascovirus 3h]BBB16544.1 hypothetical protein [Heliothis virescens ascovirus 3j]AFV50332.1 hypothetical protein [Heliothis virescens ascovirus 3g]AJP09038.1 hypothetical protein [Heliothis virescens ascovirus 3f]